MNVPNFLDWKSWKTRPAPIDSQFSIGVGILFQLVKLRKSSEGWKIVNIIINGVNLGLTFRNQFQALAKSHDENIEVTLENWVSDAGDAGIT